MRDVTKIIGERIRAFRIKQGLSQEAAAEKAGISHVFYGSLERAEKNPSVETVYKICSALGMPLELVFEKLVDADVSNETPRKIYDLVTALKPDDQVRIYEIVKMILEVERPRQKI